MIKFPFSTVGQFIGFTLGVGAVLFAVNLLPDGQFKAIFKS